jgi:hypothetical protein
MSPFSPNRNQENWDNWSSCLGKQISEAREKCPICGNILTEIFGAIGGFPGHKRIHSGPLVGYNCFECMRRFSLEKLARLKEKKVEKKAYADFAKIFFSVFKNLYIYLIIAGLVLLFRSFWKGAVIGVLIAFLVSLIMFLWAEWKGKKNGTQTP